LNHLGEHSDPRAARALVPYLTDIDEGVRFVTVEALLRQKDPEPAREPLLTLLTNEKEESRRIKKRILDGFADLGWDVKGFSGTVEKMLPRHAAGRAPRQTTARSNASRSDGDVAWMFMAPWLVFGAWWLVRSLGTARTETRESHLSRLTHAIFLGGGTLLLVVPIAPLQRRLWWPSATLAWIGLGLEVAGVAFAIWAREHLGKLWSGTSRSKKGTASCSRARIASRA